MTAANGAPRVNWQSRLRKGRGGGYAADPFNVSHILLNHSKFAGLFAYDAFIGDIVTTRAILWPPHLAPFEVKAGEWTEEDTGRLRIWLSENFEGLDISSGALGEILKVVAMRVRVHPIVDWLRGLKWDRKKRIDDWLVRICGAENTPYVREVGKNFLLGAVARVMCPGCQVDTMPIFEGDQGLRKTSMLRALAGERWFLETNIEIGSLDSYQVLRRKWIVEFGELESIHRADLNRVKQYISGRVDTYRPSYGRGARDFPRQCVFAGTANPIDGAGYLKDETGARRFWPVRLLREVDLAKLVTEREQLWAEAVARYLKNESWYFTDPTLIREQREQTELRRQRHPWEAAVGTWLDALFKKNPFVKVTTHDVLTKALGLEVGRLTRSEEITAASVLRACGWTNVERPRDGGGRQRTYSRPLPVQAVADQEPDQGVDQGSDRAPAEPKKRGAQTTKGWTTTPKLDQIGPRSTEKTSTRSNGPMVQYDLNSVQIHPLQYRVSQENAKKLGPSDQRRIPKRSRVDNPVQPSREVLDHRTGEPPSGTRARPNGTKRAKKVGS